MTESEKVHFLTEAIYKNILDNFNPGVRQLITTGRALQKALHNVATSAKSYIDVLYSLAQSAQVCKGATSEIGAALVQIAEVQKEINTQIIDNIKSFHAELLIPTENKQENEFKQVQLMHKKYCAGHKYHIGTYDKAQSTLKKHKKKTKAKYGFDQKEMQYSREVRDCQNKLEDYHMQNLRFALVEERKRYCFVLDRICAMVRNYASHHSKAHELLTHRLSEWSELTKNPHILPSSSEAVIQAFRNQDEVYNTAEDMQEQYDRQISPGDSASMTYGTAHRLQQFHNMDSVSMTYGNHSNGINNKAEDPYATRRQVVEDPYATRKLVQASMSVGPPARGQVRALYAHAGASDTQLTFSVGDSIALIGEKRDGWQYGHNLRTHQLGWFPISFTEPTEPSNQGPERPESIELTTQRVKSLGNLADLSQNADYHMAMQSSVHSDSDSVVRPQVVREHRAHTMGNRPLSMHGDLAMNNLQAAPKQVYPPIIEENNKSEEYLKPPVSYADTSPEQESVMYPKSEIVKLRCTPTHVHMKSRSLSIYDANRGLANAMYMHQHMPAPYKRPVPPLPPSAYFDNDTRSQYKKQPLHDLSPGVLREPPSYPAPSPPGHTDPPLPPPPPPPPPPNHPPQSRSHPPPLHHTASSPAMMRAQQPHAMYTTQHSQAGDYMSHQQLHQYGGGTPSPANSSSGYSSSTNRQGSQSPYSHHSGVPSGFPPPPPGLAPPAPSGDYQEDHRHNPFANVTLRRNPHVNDRSAPRIY